MGAVKTNNSIKRRRQKFLKKYNYDPETKTIKIKSGKRVSFDNGNRTKSKYSHLDNSFSISDKDLKRSYKTIDTIVYHECGHEIYQTRDINSNTDTSMYCIEAYISSMLHRANGDRDLAFNMINRHEMDTCQYEELLELDKNASNKEYQFIRKENYKIWDSNSEYEYYDKHRQSREFEADSVAVANTSKENVIKALKYLYEKDFYKKKDFDNIKLKTARKKLKEEINTRYWNDYFNNNLLSTDEIAELGKLQNNEKLAIDNLSDKDLIRMERERMHRYNKEHKETMQKRIKMIKNNDINYDIYK